MNYSTKSLYFKSILCQVRTYVTVWTESQLLLWQLLTVIHIICEFSLEKLAISVNSTLVSHFRPTICDCEIIDNPDDS